MPDEIDDLIQRAKEIDGEGTTVDSLIRRAKEIETLAAERPVLSGLRHLPRPAPTPDPVLDVGLGAMSFLQSAADRLGSMPGRVADALGLLPDEDDARYLAEPARADYERVRRSWIEQPISSLADVLRGDPVGAQDEARARVLAERPSTRAAVETGASGGSMAADTLAMIAGGTGLAKGALATAPGRMLAASRVGRFGVEALAFGGGNILVDPSHPLVAAANGAISLTGMKAGGMLVRPIANILGRWAGRTMALGAEGEAKVARVIAALRAAEGGVVGAGEGLGMSAIPHLTPGGGTHSALAGALGGEGADQLSVAVNVLLTTVLKAAHPEVSPAFIEGYVRGEASKIPPADRAKLDVTAAPLVEAASEARTATDKAAAGEPPLTPEKAAADLAAAKAAGGPVEPSGFDPALAPSAPTPAVPAPTAPAGTPTLEPIRPVGERRGAGKVVRPESTAPRDVIEAEAARLLADSKERKRLEDGMRAEGLTPEVFEAGRAGATIPSDALERSNASTWEDAVRKRAGDVAAMRWERGQLKAGETTPGSLLEGAAAPAAPPPPVESPAGKALIDFATADVEVPGARTSSTFGVGRALDTGPDPSPAGSALVDFAEAMAQGRSLREAARASATPPEAPLERPSQRSAAKATTPKKQEQVVTTKAEAGSGAKARTPTESLRGWKVVDAKYQEDASGEWVTIASPSTRETKVVEGRFVPLLVESGVLRAPRVPEISLGRDVEIPVTGWEKPVKGKYAAVEGDTVLPSHDPARDMEPSEGYPTENKLQERDYRNPRDRATIEDRKKKFKPGEMVNTAPRATDGPTTVAWDPRTKKWVALNGNGREILRRSLTPEQKTQYREYLLDHAAEFGLDPEAVRAAKDPVLVRIVEMDPRSAEAAEFGRRGNMTGTASIPPEKRAARVASLIDDSVVNSLTVDPDKTFSQAVVDVSRGREFRKALERQLAPEERAEFFKDDGTLTEAGKELTENVLLVRALGPDVVAELPRNLRNSLSDASIQLAQLKRDPANAEYFAALREAAKVYREGLDGGAIPPSEAWDPANLVPGPEISPLGRTFVDFLYAYRQSPRKMREGLTSLLNQRAGEGGLLGDEGPIETAKRALAVPAKSARKAADGDVSGFPGRPAASFSPGDPVVVTTTDGRSIEGTYQRETGRRVVVKAEDGSTERIPRSDVAKVEAGKGENPVPPRESMDRSDEMSPEARAEVDAFSGVQRALDDVLGTVRRDTKFDQVEGTTAPTEPSGTKGAISAPEVVQAFSDLSDVVERVGRLSPQAAGTFNRKTGSIRNRQAWNLTTSAHEHGHGLEILVFRDLFTLPASSPVRSAVAREFVKLGHDLYGTVRPAGGYAREGLAEFMRFYLTQGDAAARKAAPEAWKWFSAWLKSPANKELSGAFAKARAAVERWKAQGAEKRVRSSIPRESERKPTLMQRVGRALSQVRRKFATSLDPLDRAFEYLHGLDPSRAPAHGFNRVAKSLQGTANRVGEAIEGPQVSFSGRVLGPGVQEIVAPVAKNAAEYDNFRTLWAALHSLERRGYDVDRMLMERRAPDKWAQEPDRKVVQTLPVSDADLIRLLLDTPSPRLDAVRDAAAKFAAWQANWLADAVQAGVISTARYEAITQSNKWRYYSPMIAHIDRVGADRGADFDTGKVYAGGKATDAAPAGRIRGKGQSYRRIDPVEAAVLQAKRVVEWTNRQAVYLALIKHVERIHRAKGTASGGSAAVAEQVLPNTSRYGANTKQVLERIQAELDARGASGDIDVRNLEGDLPDFLDIFSLDKSASPSESVIPILRPRPDGTDAVELWYVNPDVVQSISGESTRDLSVWTRTLETLARVQKFGATEISPDFAVRNVFRDLGDYFFNNPDISTREALGGWLKSLAKTIAYESGGSRSKPRTGDLAASKGGAAGIEIPRVLGARISEFLGPKSVESLVRRPTFSAPARGGRKIMDWLRASDVVPRAAAARRLLREMGAIDADGNMVRELTFQEAQRVTLAYKEATIDFNDAGTLVRRWNRVVPFLNAKVQGLRRAAQAIEKNPRAWFLRQVSTWALTRLPLLVAQKDDPRFLALTPEQRTSNVFITDLGIRIPSGATGAWAQNLFDAVFMLSHTKDVERFGDDLRAILRSGGGSVPEWLPPVVREVYAQALNRDLHRDSSIVPRAVEERAMPENEKTTPNTQRTYDAIANTGASFGLRVSPTRLKHFADEMTGGLSSAAVDTVEMFASAFGFKRKKADVRPVAERTPVARVFRAPGGSEPATSYNVERFYDRIDALRREAGSKRTPPTFATKAALSRMEVAADVLKVLTKAKDLASDSDTVAKIRRRMDEVASTSVAGKGPADWESAKAMLEAALVSWKMSKHLEDLLARR